MIRLVSPWQLMWSYRDVRCNTGCSNAPDRLKRQSASVTPVIFSVTVKRAIQANETSSTQSEAPKLQFISLPTHLRSRGGLVRLVLAVYLCSRLTLISASRSSAVFLAGRGARGARGAPPPRRPPAPPAAGLRPEAAGTGATRDASVCSALGSMAISTFIGRSVVER